MAGTHEEVYLKIANLKVLYQALGSVADKWYPFGEALKIRKATLDGLGSTNMDNSTQLLLVLSHYLNGTQVSPTITDVVAALRKVGFDGVASSLEKFPVKDTSEDTALPEHQQSHVGIHIKPTGLKTTPLVSGKLRRPRGLGISKEGVYLANNCGACIMRIHGNIETTSVLVRDPFRIAFGGDGSVYVTDCSFHLLYMLDEKLNYKKKAGTGREGRCNDEFSYPHGLEVIRGMVYVCDNGNCRVKVYDQELNYKYSFGNREKEGHFDETTLFGPVDIADDSKDGLYVADDKKMAIVKFRLREVGPPVFVRNIEHKRLQIPSGLTVDSYDFVYVIDRLTKCIFVFQPTGALVAEFSNDERIQAPQVICCVKGRPGSSVLYVSDAESEVNVWKCNIEYS